MSKNKTTIKEEKPLVDAPVLDTISTGSYSDASQLYGGASVLVGAHLSFIDEYVKAMAPGVPLTPSQGLEYQLKLNRTIRAIIEMEDIQDFAHGMDGLLEYFYKYRHAALHIDYTQRFVDKMILDSINRNLYTTLCHIFYIFSDETLRNRYGKNIHLTGEGNLLQHLPYEVAARLRQYLLRYFE